MKKILIVFLLLIFLGGGVFALVSRKPSKPPVESPPSEVREQVEEIEQLESGEPEGTESAQEVETEEQSLEIETGEEFSLTLESNPTTGYSWQEEFDADYLQLINKEFIAASPEELVGASGKETFTFLALAPGETEINLSYLRPWEEGAIKKALYQILIK